MPTSAARPATAAAHAAAVKALQETVDLSAAEDIDWSQIYRQALDPGRSRLSRDRLQRAVGAVLALADDPEQEDPSAARTRSQVIRALELRKFAEANVATLLSVLDEIEEEGGGVDVRDGGNLAWASRRGVLMARGMMLSRF
jgi:hypothetical protein